jgi:hypothetical protein
MAAPFCRMQCDGSGVTTRRRFGRLAPSKQLLANLLVPGEGLAVGGRRVPVYRRPGEQREG